MNMKGKANMPAANARVAISIMPGLHPFSGFLGFALNRLLPLNDIKGVENCS